LISFELEKLKILLPPDDALVKDIEDFQYHLDQDYSLFLTSGFLNRLIELFKTSTNLTTNSWTRDEVGRQLQCWANKIPEKLCREELKSDSMTIETAWKLKIA
jgi:hypothetical protein